MDLLEHQGKALLAAAGIPVPVGMVAKSPLEALQVAEALGGGGIVKAQIPIGGRGKAGAIKAAGTPEEAQRIAEELLSSEILGFKPDTLLVEARADIAAEYYAAILMDRETRSPILLFSSVGGVDIETLAREHPEDLLHEAIDPVMGLLPYQARAIAVRSGLREYVSELTSILVALYALFRSHDCLLLEINPLVRLTDGRLVALDAKVTVDDNALFRHPELELYVEEAHGTDAERKAREHGVNFVPVGGDVGIIGNGAGLVMATMDLVAGAGLRPANFLDVGGGAKADQIAASLNILIGDPNIRLILLDIFGGITNCTEVSRGLLQVLGEHGGKAPRPLVVRFDGNGAAEATEMLDGSGVTIAPSLEEAASEAARIMGIDPAAITAAAKDDIATAAGNIDAAAGDARATTDDADTAADGGSQ